MDHEGRSTCRRSRRRYMLISAMHAFGDVRAHHVARTFIHDFVRSIVHGSCAAAVHVPGRGSCQESPSAGSVSHSMLDAMQRSPQSSWESTYHHANLCSSCSNCVGSLPSAVQSACQLAAADCCQHAPLHPLGPPSHQVYYNEYNSQLNQ
jgi:hypothetical protein